MYKKFWIPFLLCVIVILVGCFDEADNPLQEEVEEPGAVEVPGEVPENEERPPQDLVPQGPVVQLVSDGLEWRGDRVTLRAYVEIDTPLEHHLFLYIESEEQEQDDDFFDVPGKIGKSRTLIVLERGKTETGSFGMSTWEGRNMLKKMTLRLLPGEERQEIELPEAFFFGRPEIGPTPNSGEVPEGYQFNPYQVGEPSEVSHEFD